MGLAEQNSRVRKLAERARDANRPQTVHDCFRKQVCEAGSRTAILCDDRQLSYLAIDARSDAVARKLMDKGIGRGSLVGLFAPRGPETVAAMLGILKAGATYLPLDPTANPKLLRYICDDATPALMLMHEDLMRQQRVPQFWSCPSLDIGPDAAFEPRRAAPLPMIGPEDVACVIYAASANGQPRGVQIPHRAIMRRVIEADYVQLGPDQVVLQLSPLAFDAATFEIWGALLNGGKLAIVAAMHPSVDTVADVIARHGVTTAYLASGLFHLMVDQRLDALEPLRQLLTGGDVLSPAHVEKAREALPGCVIVCVNGPTENTTFSFAYVVPPERPVTGPLPMGRPIAHCEAYVLDDARRVINDGREGELYVGGPGLAHGYINRSQLTAERFAHAAGMVHRLFRTGDRVRRRPDGNFEFRGCVDRHVRINGKRIELDNIEACLRRSGIVGDAAVTTVGEVSDRRVAAFVTPPPGRAVSTGELRAFLAQELPPHMIPAVVQALQTLPLSSSGRIDRTALAGRVPPPPGHVKTNPVLPASRGPSATTLTQGKLLRIWSEVLGNDNITPRDSFFDLGGSSEQLVQVHALVQSTFRVNVELVDLFTYPRLDALAVWIDRMQTRKSPATSKGLSGWQLMLGRGKPATDPLGATP